MCISLYVEKQGGGSDVTGTLSLNASCLFLFMAYTECHLLNYGAQHMRLCAKGESVCFKITKNVPMTQKVLV